MKVNDEFFIFEMIFFNYLTLFFIDM